MAKAPDIVTRLRDLARRCKGSDDQAIADEAADEIIRLREHVRIRDEDIALMRELRRED